MFHNIKIVGNGDMPLYLVESKDSNVSNLMAHINMRIIINSVGVTKPTKKQTHHALKLKKANHIHTYSSVPIVKMTIRWTSIVVCFGSIGSTANGTRKNTLRSMKTEQIQFILLWMVAHNDL